MLIEQALLVINKIINESDNKSICKLSETCKYFRDLTKSIRYYIKVGITSLCTTGDVQGIKYLVSRGDVTGFYEYLKVASEHGQLEVVKYISVTRNSYKQ